MGLVRLPHGSHRWLWFACLYAAGVVTVGVVAYGLRALLAVFR
jgi:hypothetical protein